MAGEGGSETTEGDFWIAKLNSDGSLAWEENYGGSSQDIAFAVQQTVDGGYVVSGYTLSDDGDISENQGEEDIWIIKLNTDGSLVWEKTYGGSLEEKAYGIQQSMDGGYIIAGHTRSDDGDIEENQGSGDIWVLKLDAVGTLLWEETYGGSSGENVGENASNGTIGNDCVLQTADGKYIVVGETISIDGDVGENNGSRDIWVLKLDTDGTLLWEETYGGASAEGGTSIQQTLDGGYILGGYTSSTGIPDAWIGKIDTSGNLLWEETYGGSSRDYVSMVKQVSGCEYVFTGLTWSTDGDVGPNDFDILFPYLYWVVKLQMQWPPPTVSNPQNFCWSDSATLTDLGVTGNGAPTGFPPTFTWYADELGTIVLPETTPLVDGETYYVSQAIDGCESPLAEVVVSVIPDTPPIANFPQAFCEDEQAFVSDLVVTGQNLIWYEDAGATTLLPVNTELQNGQTYYVSQTIDNCESSLLAIEVEVFPPPFAFQPPPFILCDENGNGFEEFYLPGLDAVITGGTANITVSYHLSFSDAENAANPLPDAYTNTESPSQTLFARILDTVTGCDSTVEVELVVSPIPEIMEVQNLVGCDDGNGEAVFDLTQNNNHILGNQNSGNLVITYHETDPDAENGDNPIPNPENYTNTDKTIFVRLENTVTSCFATGSFAIVVNPRPSINAVQPSEEFCSDEQGGNSATVNLSMYDTQVNPNTPTGTEVVYYENLARYNAGEIIENPDNYTTTINPQTFIAEVVDTATGCPSLTYAEITIHINDRPIVDLSTYDEMVICWDSDLSTPVEDGNYENIVLETWLDAATHNFTWTLDGVELSETGPNLEVAEPGVYAVTVSDSDGISTVCKSTSTVTIMEANPPEFQLDRTTEVIANGHALLVVNVTGTGNYEFRLDDGSWIPLGEDGVLLFTEVIPGFHTVYGRSLEGCGTTAHSITLIGYPKFFTPNGDGQNDRWNIIGLENQPQAGIFIFDRYGKLLESLNPAAPGWDGTYNGKRMPSNDYWFRVNFMETLADGTERQQVFKANFTLKR